MKAFSVCKLIKVTKVVWSETPLMQSYGFSTPVTHTQVLIEINFQAPKTLKTNY